MSVTARLTKNGTVYDARYRVAGKHSKMISKTFLRKADAREFLVKKTNELLENRLGLASSGRFEDATLECEARFWLEQMQIELSQSWLRRASDIIDSALIPKWGHLSVDKFTVAFIRRMQTELRGMRRQSPRKELSNASINRVTEVLCAILNYSVKTRRIPFNPAKGYSKLPDDRCEMSTGNRPT